MDATVGTLPVVLLSVGLLFLGFVLGWFSSTKAAHSKIHRAESTAEQLVEDARQEAESMKRTSVLEARDEMHEERIAFERKMEETQEEVKRSQVQLTSLDQQLQKRADLLNHKEELILQLPPLNSLIICFHITCMAYYLKEDIILQMPPFQNLVSVHSLK